MATRAEMEARIRQMAAERGLDPDRWAKIVAGESGWNPAARLTTAKEDSGGLLQLNTKNGVGVAALKAGINPHDPAQWESQAAFGLDYAKKHGDRAWTAARNLDKPRNSASTQTPPRRPDGAPGPRDAPSAPANPQQGTLASIYEPFQKLATEQKEQQVEQQLATAQALATAAADRPPIEQAPPPPAPPAALPPDFAALMFPRIRRGLLGGDGYGLLG
jgi:hypothetical protein